MAKDTTTGPVSKPEGGHYESSEDVRMNSGELPQTEVMSEFDKDLAAMLVEGGYHSLFQIAHACDGVLMELKGVGLEELAAIREKAPFETLIPTPEAKIEVELDIEVEEGEPEAEKELPELAHLEVGPVGARPTAPEHGPDLVLKTLGDKIGTILVENGYVSLRGIAVAKDAELLAINGIGKATLKKIRAVVLFSPAPLPTSVDNPQVSERVRRSMESAKSQ